MKLHVLADRHMLTPKQSNDRELLVRITAPEIATADEPTPLRLSFALDSSWSMTGKRLKYAKRAIYKALELLGPNDSASITRFSSEAKTLIGLTKTDDDGKARIAAILARIETKQGTNLYDGWDLAAEAIKHHNGEISRVLLLSDGIVNCGERRIGAISRWVARASSKGVRTSVLGVGHDYDDDLLQAISAAGHGNFYFAEFRGQIPEFVAQEISEARQIVARGVLLRLELPPGAEVRILGDWVVSSQDHITTIHLPDFIANQIAEIGIMLRLPVCADDEQVRVGIDLSTDKGPIDSDTVIYAVGNIIGQTRDRDLFLAIANLRVHQAVRDAVRLNRSGDAELAGDLFDELSVEFCSRGIDPEEYPELFNTLREHSALMRRHIMENERKALSLRSVTALRTRNPFSKRNKGD